MSEVNKKIISLEVRGEYILGSGVVIGAQGSFDSVYLRIKLDDKWQGLTKYATWINAQGTVGVQEPITALDLVYGEPDTYDIPVPQFATEYAGTVRLALSGYVIGGEAGKEIESLLNTVSGAFKVLESGAVRLDGGRLDASLEEQFVDILNKATQLLDNAEKTLADANETLEDFNAAETERAAAETERAKREQERSNSVSKALKGVNIKLDEVDEIVKTTAGRRLENGAEIFNDYENNNAISPYSTAKGSNNVAGSKAFNVSAVDVDNKTFTLSSVDKLAVGMTYSCHLDHAWASYGKITKINTKNNIVTVDNIPNCVMTENYHQFWISGRADLGDIIIGNGAFAEGMYNKSQNACSHTEGCENIASGKYAHAEGRSNEAGGFSSHAEGRYTKANGFVSHAEGASTEALGDNTHAEGQETKAIGNASHSEGVKTQAKGYASHTEGQETIADGAYSHSEGYGNNSAGKSSHSEGWGTKAMGLASHAEGQSNTAKGDYSHAEGRYTSANGERSHSEGNNTQANGAHSHAQNEWCVANNNASHAEGFHTIADGWAQHVQGKYNASDKTKAHIVGGGDTETSRRNIHTLDWYGNAYYAGTVETKALILLSGSNKRFKITVDDSGKLTATQIT